MKAAIQCLWPHNITYTYIKSSLGLVIYLYRNLDAYKKSAANIYKYVYKLESGCARLNPAHTT